MKRARWTRLCAIAAVALVAAACGGRAATTTTAPAGQTPGQKVEPTEQGITHTEMILGNSMPYSGALSAYGTIGKAEAAFFDYVNKEKGGVKTGYGDTLKVTFKTLDDAYAPAQTVANVKQLLEQDKAFAIFSTLGTPSNTAIRPDLNDKKVPQVFIATGATTWGADMKQYPWTISYQLDYKDEAQIFATYVKKEKPNGKVAILFQNDDYGHDYADNFKNFLKGSGVTIAAEQTYEATDPSVDSQVVNLANSKADVFFNVSTPKFAAQAIKKSAEIGWKPLHLLNGVSISKAAVLTPAGLDASKDVVSVLGGKQPDDAKWASDPGMMEYKRILGQYGPGIKAEDAFAAAGFAYYEAMVHAIEGMKAPTRQALMDSARNLSYTGTLALSGVKVKTSPTDGFPIQAGQVHVFDGAAWQAKGEVIDVGTN